MSSQVYLTFPIVLLNKATVDIRQTCSDIFNYCGFVEAKRIGENEPDTLTELMEQASTELEIQWGDSLASYNAGQRLFNKIPPRSPMTSINHDIVFSYFENHKTDFEIVTFLAYAAIRSIIQTKPYVRITNDFLIARMAGYPTISSACNSVFSNDYKRNKIYGKKILYNVPPLIKNHSTRYRLDKIKSELQAHWGLKLYGGTKHFPVHGFYVSFKKSLKELVKIIEAKRIKNIQAKRKAEIDDALKEFQAEYFFSPNEQQ